MSLRVLDFPVEWDINANHPYDPASRTFTEPLMPGQSIKNLGADWFFFIPEEKLGEPVVYNGGLRFTDARHRRTPHLPADPDRERKGRCQIDPPAVLPVSLKKTLRQNRWRYLSHLAGFFLFVGPLAFLARGLNYLTGNMAQATAHTLCLRMPVDWLFGGRWFALLGSVAALFILVVVGIALFAGPAFCGWLCPVGGISEGVSRAVPLPERFRLRIKDPSVSTGLRYGCFIGFIAVSVIVAYRLVAMSSVCCRYCSTSVMQNLVDGALWNTIAVTYWSTGAIISLFAWLVRRTHPRRALGCRVRAA